MNHNKPFSAAHKSTTRIFNMLLDPASIQLTRSQSKSSNNQRLSKNLQRILRRVPERVKQMIMGSREKFCLILTIGLWVSNNSCKRQKFCRRMARWSSNVKNQPISRRCKAWSADQINIHIVNSHNNNKQIIISTALSVSNLRFTENKKESKIKSPIDVLKIALSIIKVKVGTLDKAAKMN